MHDRMADRDYLTQEVLAWINNRNSVKSDMKWRFTTDDARIKLNHLGSGYILTAIEIL